MTVVEDAVAEVCRARHAWMDDHGAEATAEFLRRLRILRHRWDLEVVAVFGDGVGAPVLAVRRPSALDAVLKIDLTTWGSAGRRVLRAASGHGYVRVLDHADDLGAVLLERLGPPLAEAGLSPYEQVMTMVDLLAEAWNAVPVDPGMPHPHKGQRLAELVTEHRHRAPRHDRVLDEAHRIASQLDARGGRTVVVHGDPHPGNTLRRGDGWAFVDPDGFACDASYDVGVTVRDWSPQVLALAAAAGASAARAWHDDLVAAAASRAGLAADLVADWAFVERVTTGLWLERLGHHDEAEAFLAAAEVLLHPGGARRG